MWQITKFTSNNKHGDGNKRQKNVNYTLVWGKLTFDGSMNKIMKSYQVADAIIGVERHREGDAKLGQPD